jgi:hypothetical protein
LVVLPFLSFRCRSEVDLAATYGLSVVSRIACLDPSRNISSLGIFSMWRREIGLVCILWGNRCDSCFMAALWMLIVCCVRIHEFIRYLEGLTLTFNYLAFCKGKLQHKCLHIGTSGLDHIPFCYLILTHVEG